MKTPNYPKELFIMRENEGTPDEFLGLRETAAEFIETGAEKKHVARYVLEEIVTIESKVSVSSGVH
jgi:hypothetical protein